LITAASGLCLADAPVLPQGLVESEPAGGGSGPALPAGLAEEGRGDAGAKGPVLPEGLGGGAAVEIAEPAERTGKAAPTGDRLKFPEGFSGYWEVRAGTRLKEDPVQDDISLAETRLQLQFEKYLGKYLPGGGFQATGDLVFDAVEKDRGDVDLEEGDGFLDMRQLWVSFTPAGFMDVKLGRQVLTWGTGNLLFLNDLFPKDYQSFFLGRDLEYLKAPSDAVKASLYGDLANLDLVYTPRFDADRFVDGSRLSFFDSAAGGLRGEDSPLDPVRPEGWFEDDELAARLHRSLGGYELAAYGYRGFWKEPAGTDAAGRRTFPDLSVYGSSIRGPAASGIANAEVAWYDSRQDRQGNDSRIRNSQVRLLVGYEREIAADLTMGLQYYVDHMLDYDNYRENLPSGTAARDRDRRWITVELTQKLMAQDQLQVGCFAFYSPSESDAYLRPAVVYDVTDSWRFELGGNVFLGRDRHTFFGQFTENTNIYAAVRYSF